MAFQFKITRGKIEYIGISRFFSDKKGQYQGNFLNGWNVSASSGLFFSEIEPETVQYAETLPEIFTPHLIKALESSEFAQLYDGNFGVDILIFRDENGELKVNPCLEINVRQNMGLLSLPVSYTHLCGTDYHALQQLGVGQYFPFCPEASCSCSL